MCVGEGEGGSNKNPPEIKCYNLKERQDLTHRQVDFSDLQVVEIKRI